MLSFDATSESAISAIPDVLTNQGNVQAVIYALFELALPRPSRAIFLDRTKQPVFAAECSLGQLRL